MAHSKIWSAVTCRRRNSAIPDQNANHEFVRDIANLGAMRRDGLRSRGKKDPAVWMSRSQHQRRTGHGVGLLQAFSRRPDTSRCDIEVLVSSEQFGELKS